MAAVGQTATNNEARIEFCSSSNCSRDTRILALLVRATSKRTCVAEARLSGFLQPVFPLNFSFKLRVQDGFAT